MLSIALKKTFFKLMNNSIYGRTMENLRKTANIRLVNNAKDYKKIFKQTKFYFTEEVQ